MVNLVSPALDWYPCAQSQPGFGHRSAVNLGNTGNLAWPIYVLALSNYNRKKLTL